MIRAFFPTVPRSLARAITLLMCAVFYANFPLRADETTDGKSTADGKTPAAVTTEEEPDYKNWIEFGIGGLIINGDSAQFKQEHRMSGDIFGGIQDMHYEGTVDKNVQFSIDGHAIFDNHDYDVKLELSKPNLG